MKVLNTIFLLVFAGGIFFSATGFAQANKSISEKYTFTLKSPSGEYELTGIETIIISSSGNLLRTVTCQIDPDNPIMELANPVAFLRVTAKGDFDGDGEDEVLVDEFAVLTKTGNLKMVYHLNGKNR